MKNIMRHYSTWLLIIGVAVSFFGFLNGADIYQRVKNALAEVNEYRYKNTYSIQISSIEDMGQLLEGLKLMEGNICIQDINIYVDEMGYYSAADMILKQDEELTYTFLEELDSSASEKNQVIIGKGLKECCYSKSGEENEYISLNGIEFEVVGVLGSKTSSVLDGKILFPYNEDFLLSCIDNQEYIFVSYGSNNKNIDTYFMEFLNTWGPYYEIYYEKNEEQYIEVGADNADKQFYFLISVFAIINCIVISEFWIIRRKQEIVIRKIWGYSNLKIFKMLFSEMLMLSLLAVACVWLVRVAVTALLMNDMEITVTISKLIYSVIFVIITALLIVLLPIYKVSRYKPSEELEG